VNDEDGKQRNEESRIEKKNEEANKKKSHHDLNSSLKQKDDQE
jgi:hypothetical protein